MPITNLDPLIPSVVLHATKFADFRAALIVQCPGIVDELDQLKPGTPASSFFKYLTTNFPTWQAWAKDYFSRCLQLSELIGMINQLHESKVQKTTVTMAEVGPPIWKDIHTFAKSWNGDVVDQTTFLDGVLGRLPCGACKIGWTAMYSENPVPTDNAANFFAWTVMIHNKVNEKLNKPDLPLEDAQALY